MKMSRFSGVPAAPPIEVFALNTTFKQDRFEHKVNLGVGAYRTEEGQSWILPVVKTAEQVIANDDTLDKEYLPVLGLESFTQAAIKLVLGQESPAILENRAFGIQTLSGTGALRIGAEFLSKMLKMTTYYCSSPTWENHKLLFDYAGFRDSRTYRYWHHEKRAIHFEGYLEDLRAAPANSVIILHAAAHNPTGIDATHDQWRQIADVMQERQLFPFFDAAYQGFASGDIERDVWPVRYFVERGFEMLIATSFAKNFGIYNERAGNLTVVMNENKEIPAVKSQFTLLVRGMYSNPPVHGARVVAYVLNNKQLFEEWKQNVKSMADRIKEMRTMLRQALERLQTPGSWEHITNQIGMFSYTGLDEQQSLRMIEKHHVYMLRSGRINMSGLNSRNVEYVARAMNEVILSVPSHKM